MFVRPASSLELDEGQISGASVLKFALESQEVGSVGFLEPTVNTALGRTLMARYQETAVEWLVPQFSLPAYSLVRQARVSYVLGGWMSTIALSALAAERHLDLLVEIASTVDGSAWPQRSFVTKSGKSRTESQAEYLKKLKVHIEHSNVSSDAGLVSQATIRHLQEVVDIRNAYTHHRADPLGDGAMLDAIRIYRLLATCLKDVFEVRIDGHSRAGLRHEVLAYFEKRGMVSWVGEDAGRDG